MRELKFRHCNIFTGEMLYSEKHFCNLEHYFANREYDSSDEMQFTGLKDKNGVEIYEGDIVKCIKTLLPGNTGWTEILEVEPITCSQFDDDESGGQDYVESVVSIEVIGNIYENPEFLK